MPSVSRFAGFHRLGFLVILLLAVAVQGATATRRALADHASPAHGKSSSASAHDMTDAQMRKVEAEWFAQHPEAGVEASRQALAQGTFADTFFVYFSEFDNGDPDNPDVAQIFAGETVLWVWVDGTHTITNGEDSSDPNSGNLFNASSNSGNQTFAYTFNTVGMQPFYCFIHEFLPMKGYVNVRTPAGVTPIGSAVARIGFASSPSPNPSRAGFTFRFGMRERGRVRAQVFDAAGRAVSTVIDRTLEPGSYAASWDGRGRSGTARPGVYWLRLRVPGAQESRRLVVSE